MTSKDIIRLYVGILTIMALLSLFMAFTVRADEIAVYRLSLEGVHGKVAISTLNPNEDLSYDECMSKAADVMVALSLDYPPACIEEIVVRQQG